MFNKTLLISNTAPPIATITIKTEYGTEKGSYKHMYWTIDSTSPRFCKAVKIIIQYAKKEYQYETKGSASITAMGKWNITDASTNIECSNFKTIIPLDPSVKITNGNVIKVDEQKTFQAKVVLKK